MRRIRRFTKSVLRSERPKNIYSTMPTTGTISSTVIHASDLTGLRFSDITTQMMLSTVQMYATVIITYTQSSSDIASIMVLIMTVVYWRLCCSLC